MNNKGFTMIEMIVAIGIFAIVITVSLASFLNVSSIQKRAEALRVINNNLNFSLETMMREIRAGSNYRVESEGTSLTIASVSGGDIIYRLNNDLPNNGRIEKSVAGNFVYLTDPEMDITKLLFVARGQNLGDGLQPIITIVIAGSTGVKTGSFEKKPILKFNLQTTVSQRKLDS